MDYLDEELREYALKVLVNEIIKKAEKEVERSFPGDRLPETHRKIKVKSETEDIIDRLINPKDYY